MPVRSRSQKRRLLHCGVLRPKDGGSRKKGTKLSACKTMISQTASISTVSFTGSGIEER
jgi:hypothetical protein